MNALVEEWFDKADKDLETAIELAKLKNHRFDENIGFHCQQYVEKYLKGFLIHHEIKFRKTHSIAEVWYQCNQLEDFSSIKEVTGFSNYAVTIRYPGDEIILTENDINEMIEQCIKTKKLVKSYLSEDRLL